MKCKNWIAGLLLCALLVVMLPVTAYAHEVPDETKKGGITVELCYDGRAVTGGRLAAYRVGQIRENDGNYSFGKTTAMEGFPGDYNDVGDPKLAEEAAAFVEKQQIPACATAENEAGKAVFTGLELGVYLIVQTEAADGGERLNPFLVSLPMNEDGHYVYEVNAEGKLQFYRDMDVPAAPPGPSGPGLPYTGQLNWPIPVLAGSGVALFLAGWVLCFRKKKNGYET